MEQPEGAWFELNGSYVLTIATGPGAVRRTRVLLWRNGLEGAHNRPLLVDAEELSVKVVEEEFPPLTGFAVHDGALWWVGIEEVNGATVNGRPSPRTYSLYRYGWPGFRQEVVAHNVYPPRTDPGNDSSLAIFHGGRVFLVGREVLMADRPEGPFRRAEVGGDVPRGGHRGHDIIVPPAPSNHYGWVSRVADGRAAPVFYQVEFHPQARTQPAGGSR